MAPLSLKLQSLPGNRDLSGSDLSMCICVYYVGMFNRGLLAVAKFSLVWNGKDGVTVT